MNESKGTLNLYSIFHLNLAYSSIPEKRRADVIERCYWPLLKLANDFPGAITIEASGYTLEQINTLDPRFISTFKTLCNNGAIQFVGSGYAQIVGPLVPARVNEENLKIGNKVYELILGKIPRTAYVNEQAYSRGLVAHYKNAGYETIIMEWNNPHLAHPEWPKEFQYYAHTVTGHNNETIGLVWNNSIAFQKFQQYAHNEIGIEEYISYLDSHAGEEGRTFSLYGNDAEIFDFRPGRYKTEALLNGQSEWGRIESLFSRLSEEGFSFIFPECAQNTQSPHAQQRISLESGDQPIPVKKQMKYNITRWALAGRDNVKNNAKCYRIFHNLLAAERGGSEREANEMLWKELCYLWGSDFRTHIEEERYKKFLKQLGNALEKSKNIASETEDSSQAPLPKKKINLSERDGRVVVETSSVHAVFNIKRGLTTESLSFPHISKHPLIGALPHGYYDDITLGNDFLSGHTSIDVPMRPEMTDLVNVSDVQTHEGPLYFEISGDAHIDAGIIHKTVKIYKDKPKIDYIFSFDLKGVSPSSFRSGIFTFIPESFDRETLYYGCHNGGRDIERFSLSQSKNINPTPVSSLVSSRTALGNTEGVFVVGDKDKHCVLKTDMAQVAGLPMLQFNDMSREETFLLRVLYSLGEFNETSFLAEQRAGRKFSFPVSIEGELYANS